MPILLNVALVNSLFFNTSFFWLLGLQGMGINSYTCIWKLGPVWLRSNVHWRSLNFKWRAITWGVNVVELNWFGFCFHRSSSVWEQYCFTTTPVKLAQWITRYLQVEWSLSFFNNQNLSYAVRWVAINTCSSRPPLSMEHNQLPFPLCSQTPVQTSQTQSHHPQSEWEVF